MRYSPICTVLKNLTKERRQFFIDREFSVTLTPAGESGDSVTLIGDAFSRDLEGRAGYALMLALKNSEISISYKIDFPFSVTMEYDKPALSCDSQMVREWYCESFEAGRKAKTANTAATKGKPVTPAEPKASEPEKAPEELKQPEVTKPADTTPEAPAEPSQDSQAAKKAGRRIKVS